MSEKQLNDAMREVQEALAAMEQIKKEQLAASKAVKLAQESVKEHAM